MIDSYGWRMLAWYMLEPRYRFYWLLYKGGKVKALDEYAKNVRQWKARKPPRFKSAKEYFPYSKIEQANL